MWLINEIRLTISCWILWLCDICYNCCAYLVTEAHCYFNDNLLFLVVVNFNDSHVLCTTFSVRINCYCTANMRQILMCYAQPSLWESIAYCTANMRQILMCYAQPSLWESIAYCTANMRQILMCYAQPSL